MRPDPIAETPVKRSVVIAGHRSSISLEPLFWELLRQAAGDQGRSVNALVSEIDRHRRGNLSSALRVYLTRRLLDRS